MNPIRSIAVQYQFDNDCPVMASVVKYQVSEWSTQITFPNGVKSFDNWDVKGCRKRHYEEDVVMQNVPLDEAVRASIASTTVGPSKEPMEFGIMPSDVRRFCADLAKKPQFEHLFASEFAEIINILAQDTVIVPQPELAAIAPKPPVVTAPAPKPHPKKEAVAAARSNSKGRKFPYTQVAKLWDEGKTLREIATEIGYLDPGKDCTHTVRTFLTKMHAGYTDDNGNVVKLPYRERAKKALKAVAGV